MAAVLLGSVDLVLCSATALAVLFSEPGRWTNRIVALFLFFEGAVMFAAGMSVIDPEPTATDAGFAGVFALSISLLPALTLAVVRELPTPLVRPLRHWLATALLAAGSLALAAWTLSDPPFPRENAAIRPAYYALFATNVVSLVASLDAWRRAPRRSPARRQARLFALAFGARDLAVIAFFAGSTGKEHGPYLLGAPLIFYGTLLMVPLLAYAILRAQVLGIDLALKAGLKRALVVGAFVLVFFVASEAAEELLAASYGSLAGLAGAALLAFLIRPLEAFAQRVADGVMPRVHADEAHLRERRLEIYRAAMESAHASGGVSEKERASLAHLRQRLGLPEEDAARIERSVLEAGAA